MPSDYRPTPFDLVFTSLGAERFPAIRAALLSAGRDPRDRDAFLLERDAALLVRELRPDDGLGEGIDQLAALVHHAYLFWSAGCPVAAAGPPELAWLLGQAPEPAQEAEAEPPAGQYVQVPEQRLWARPVEGEPFEPLDGCFLAPAADGRLRVLGVFGLRPDRAGFTVVEAQGARQPDLVRPDGSALFAPQLAGGAQAGLNTVAGAEELLELGWRMLGPGVAALRARRDA
jgi:hypothetical protein